MSSAIVTILGFDEWLKAENKNLFEKLILPAGIDKETLIDNILLKSSEFELIYSNPYFMVDAIGAWSMKHKRTFVKWQEALDLEYNILDNYDRTEEWTDEGSVKSEAHDTSNSNSTNRRSAFDSNDFENDSQSDISTGSNTNNQAENKVIHTGRIRGNIGVTSSMDLIQKQLDLVSNFNIYEKITDLFISEFCILLY